MNLKYCFALLFLIIAHLCSSQTFSTFHSYRKGKLTDAAVVDNTIYICGDSSEISQVWNPLTANKVVVSIGSHLGKNLTGMSIIPGTEGKDFLVGGEGNALFVKQFYAGGVGELYRYVNQSKTNFFNGMHCLDTVHWYAGGGDSSQGKGMVHCTVNGGWNWTNTILHDTKSIKSIRFANVSTGYISAETSTGGAIYKTTDSGKTWVQVKTSPRLLTKLYCFNENIVMAVGLGGHIYRTTDGGKNWTEHDHSLIDLHDIEFFDGVTGFATGGNTGPLLLKTTDSGKTWVAQLSTFASAPLWSVALNGYMIVLTSSNGEFYIADLAAASAEEMYQAPARVYPNPVSDKLMIELAPGQKTLRVEITDMTGKTVFNGQVSENTSTLDVSMLPAGGYVILLYDINSTEYRQVLVKQ